jgi:hypothetical protein
MNHFLTGFVSNFIPTVCFFPLDTLMVRRQTSLQTVSAPLLHGVLTTALTTSTCQGCVYALYHHDNGHWLSAAVFSALCSQPFENIKICRQTRHSHVPNVLFLTRGISFCLAKEIIAVPIYFQTYFQLHSTLGIESYISGGLAGVHSWIWSYPLTTMKARYVIGQQQNWKKVYNGFSFCVLRSFFFNGCYFAIVEEMKKNYTHLSWNCWRMFSSWQ